MEKFTNHVGQAVPLVKSNVDTELIIRIQRCAQLPRECLGPWAFESLRYFSEDQLDPTCVFNNPAFDGASILLAGENFGCGSSREWAVWALAGMGLRCVIAPSFGDIFYANCFQNGMLPIRLPAATVQALSAQAVGGALVLKVDLPTQSIHGAGNEPIAFEIDPLRKSMLLQGIDEISMTLTHDRDITCWQNHDRVERPWAHMTFQI